VVSVPPSERAGVRDRFTRECLPFAGRLARRYRGRGELPDDLEQVARLGLVKAVDRYDPARGSFTAYAITTITGEIKRHFRDHTWGVHVSRRIQELGLEVRKASGSMTAELSRTPTVAEIADRLHVDEGAVREAMECSAGYTLSSLNAPASGADATIEIGDLLGTEDADYNLVGDRLTVARLLKRVPERERRLLAMRFTGDRTQSEIADELDVSQMQVSRLLRRTLDWLRAAMLSDEVPPWPGHDDVEHPHGRVALRPDGAGIVVRLEGELDRDTAEPVRLALRRAIETAGPGRVRIDLSRVPFLDAATAAVLRDAASAAALAGLPLRFFGARPFVRRVLETCGLGRLVEPSDQDA
jgi:RNA polymerase sigma-B factor